MRLVVLLMRLGLTAAAAGLPQPTLIDCYDMVGGALPPSLLTLPVPCTAKTDREADACFLLCGLCATPSLRLGLSAAERQAHCQAPDSLTPVPAPLDPKGVGALAARALINASAAHGYFWPQPKNPNSTATANAALAHLLTYMGRADASVLFAQPFTMLDFLYEHTTLAMSSRGGGLLANVTDDLWMEYVLPFGFMDEKRDLFWRWRPTFHHTFSTAPEFAAATTITEAVHALVALIPNAAMQGVTVIEHGDDREFIAGEPVKWHTGSSPLQMSSQQIVMNGGSCTGTAILLAAVLRSVGIPARVTGCSTELPDNDNDHHWVEFCPSLPPPPSPCCITP